MAIGVDDYGVGTDLDVVSDSNLLVRPKAGASDTHIVTDAHLSSWFDHKGRADIARNGIPADTAAHVKLFAQHELTAVLDAQIERADEAVFRRIALTGNLRAHRTNPPYIPLLLAATGNAVIEFDQLVNHFFTINSSFKIAL